MSLLTFIIPVRHQESAGDWDALKRRLAQTAQSIAAQTHGGWRAVVVANRGADLPPLPPGFSVERVGFPPNSLYELGSAPRERVYEAVRLDKGRRVLAGMLAAPDSRFFMVVDDDDFVSRHLAEHAADHPNANGWKIDHGYLWSEGRLLIEHDDFAAYCGTSLIVRSDLYGLPARFEDADAGWIKSMLGSHIKIAGILTARGTPLEPLPFRGAIYRVGHAGAHSHSRSLLRSHLLNKTVLRSPTTFLRHLLQFRWLGEERRAEFFGSAALDPSRQGARAPRHSRPLPA